jgi:hypothetical protein
MLLNQLLTQITNYTEQISNLTNERNKYFIETTTLTKELQSYSKLCNNIYINTKNIDEIKEMITLERKQVFKMIQLEHIYEKIHDINILINELVIFNNKVHNWQGGKYQGNIVDTPDGCRIIFDKQSRSFKYKNYINSDKMVKCKNKEECFEKAKQYLYDYYDNLNKIVSKYRYIHPQYIEVQLTQGQTFITDSKFIDIIEKNKLSASYDKVYDKYYVKYLNEHGSHEMFFKLITNISKVKYINDCTLDLREENLEEQDNAKLAKINDNEITIEFDDNNKVIEQRYNKDGYPYDTWILGKYAGTIYQRKNKNAWSIVVKKEDNTVVTKTLTFTPENKDKIYKEAIEIRNNLSDKYELTRNKIRILDDSTIEVKLTKNQIMKTDYKLLEQVEKYSVFSSKSSNENSKYYALIDINNKLLKFHKHITGFDMVDHIDRDPMNNCLSNLRECNHKINNNNRNKSESSKAVMLGVTYSERDYSFRARIKQDGKETSKQFSCKKFGYDEAKQMAIEAREFYNKEFDCKNG